MLLWHCSTVDVITPLEPMITTSAAVMTAIKPALIENFMLESKKIKISIKKKDLLSLFKVVGK